MLPAGWVKPRDSPPGVATETGRGSPPPHPTPATQHAHLLFWEDFTFNTQDPIHTPLLGASPKRMRPCCRLERFERVDRAYGCAQNRSSPQTLHGSQQVERDKKTTAPRANASSKSGKDGWVKMNLPNTVAQRIRAKKWHQAQRRMAASLRVLAARLLSPCTCTRHPRCAPPPPVRPPPTSPVSSVRD